MAPPAAQSLGSQGLPSVLVPGNPEAPPATCNTCACPHPLRVLCPCFSCIRVASVLVSVCPCVCLVHVARGDRGVHAAAQGRGRGSRRPLGWCRCAEQPPAGSLLALEPMPTFGKGLDLRRAAEEALEVKDVLNSTLDSEALKQTLYRQAKSQVGTAEPHPSPRRGRGSLASRVATPGLPGGPGPTGPPVPIALAKETPRGPPRPLSSSGEGGFRAEGPGPGHSGTRRSLSSRPQKAVPVSRWGGGLPRPRPL